MFTFLLGCGWAVVRLKRRMENMSMVVDRVATLMRPCQPLHSTLNLHITTHFMGFIKSQSNWALFGGVEECHTFLIYLFHSLPLNVLLKKSLCRKWRAEKAAVAAYPLSTLCNRHFFPPLTPPHHHTWLVHTFLVNPLSMVNFWTIVSPTARAYDAPDRFWLKSHLLPVTWLKSLFHSLPL